LKSVIYAIDDSPTVLEYIKIVLEEHFEVITFKDGLSALVALKGRKKLPELILLDIQMPDINGYDFCIQLKADQDLKKIPVIFLTAMTQDQNEERGFKVGGVDYITKPFKSPILIQRVKTHIKLKQFSDNLEKLVDERTHQLIDAYNKLEILNKAYTRFVPQNFLDILSKDHITDIKLGDHIEKDMTVLFTDIRDFTLLSESMSVTDNFRFINSFLGAISPIIRNNNGFIDKYIGDSIMALFVFPEDSINCGIEMLKALDEFNKSRGTKARPKIKIGVGVHTGKLMLGTIGEEERMEPTVISDAVNLASRLESLTKWYNTPIIVSMNTLNSIMTNINYNYRIIDAVTVVGKNKPVEIVEILDGLAKEEFDLKLRNKERLEKVIKLFQNLEINNAYKILSEMMDESKDDKVVLNHFERCEFMIKNGIPKDWDGYYKMLFK